MTCVAAPTIAQAVSEGVALAHAETCEACRAAVAEQQEMRGWLAAVPALVMDRDRREALAAEVLARADFDDADAPVAGRGRRVLGGLGILAAAAAVVALAIGGVRAGDVPIGHTIARGPDHASLEALRRGAARMTEHVMEPLAPVPAPPPPVPPAPPPAPKHATAPVVKPHRDPLAAFRAGWTAFRAGDDAAAIAAFDRATDPAVAEDALYWSAVAAERSGALDDAERRYRKLVDTFPDSPRVPQVRATLARFDVR